MRRLLITLRHPGPVQAIMSVLPDLVRKYKVYIVASNSGIDFLISRYGKNLNQAEVYYSQNGEWVKYKVGTDVENSDNLEFIPTETKGIRELTLRLANLIDSCSIDLVLRTTPAINWGLDEVSANACNISQHRAKCFCYQEDYACGNNLDSVTNPIAVVDHVAGRIINSHGLEYVVVGWLGQSMFSNFSPYRKARASIRSQLRLDEKAKVILYSFGASGKLERDLEHFKLFLTIEGCKLFYRIHPRNTDQEQEAINNVAAGKAKQLPRHFCYESALSFADYIISVASAMNQDALQYQLESGEKELNTISVYTRGEISDSIIFAALGKKDIPQHENNMGNLIIQESKLCAFSFQISSEERDSLYKAAKLRFGLSSTERLTNLMKYIGDE